ncbi:MAG: ferritin family protein [Erysipelotrichales bacterium]
MIKYKCSICGHMQDHKGNCELCGADVSKMVEVEVNNEELVWAAEHELGVAKGVDPEIYEGLLKCFNAEITEVGMYLAMARQAYREGYPEIAEVLKNIAWEEAEHAAKFEELAQDKIFANTKDNLEKMIHGENGACELRMSIAANAKKQNLDAIHDAVHEISKDEARHGKALLGLFNRYFK